VIFCTGFRIVITKNYETAPKQSETAPKQL